MITVLDKKDCCGCTACVSICHHNAIKMHCDEVGFTFPQVDVTKCVECGLCEQVCPIQNDITLLQPKTSTVAVATDNQEQLTSTSGGLASAFARYIITELKGVVYGCTGFDCFHVRHIRVEREEELALLKGSKYVQSDTSGIYQQIKKDLNNGRYVLFIGTPCQVVALRRFLHNEYTMLYCIEFVCHGVPSQQILTDAIKELCLEKSNVQVSFRYKNKRKKSIRCLQLVDNDYKNVQKHHLDKILYRKNWGTNCYITAYTHALFYRDSCYACKFATQKRVGDLTIGDFWDWEKEYGHIPNSKDGLSQMHINTVHGEELVNMMGKRICTKEISLEKLLVHSEQLREPMRRHRNNTMFLADYLEFGFEKACKKALKEDLLKIRKDYVYRFFISIPGLHRFYKLMKPIWRRLF